MTTDQGPRLTTGGPDAELAAVLDAGLDEYNFAATGTGKADQGQFSVKVVDEAGSIVGGLTAWYWAGLCGISMLWVRAQSRKDGWGSKILEAAQDEARRRGCDRVCVSSFTFQAPAFYERHGYVETGRTLGIPGPVSGAGTGVGTSAGGGPGHPAEAADVHLFKRLD